MTHALVTCFLLENRCLSLAERGKEYGVARVAAAWRTFKLRHLRMLSIAMVLVTALPGAAAFGGVDVPAGQLEQARRLHDQGQLEEAIETYASAAREA